MKKLTSLVLFVIALSGADAQVGIGTTNPDNNAILDLSSTSKGLLLPRLTDAQRDAISSPTLGLAIFDSDAGMVEVYSKTYSASTLDANAPYAATSTGGDGAWQEFTPTVSGIISEIDLYQNNPTSGQATDYPYQMTIYSNASENGGSVSGTNLGSTVTYIPAGTSTGYIAYSFSPIYLQAGTTYVFQIKPYNGSITAVYADTYFSNSDTYAGNGSWIGGFTSGDLVFKTFIKPYNNNNWVSIAGQ